VTEFKLQQVLRALPAASTPLVEAVLERAEEVGVRVHLVGGPVRDLLLDRPIRDVDLLVERDGDRDAAWLAREAAPDGAQLTSYASFGTVVLETQEAQIDLATTRSEEYPHAGALPKVSPGTLEDDLRRRDFSVNALALRLTQLGRSRTTRVVDLLGGLDDLAARRLHALHPRSFHDDPTRALRGARFAGRLGFRLSRRTRSYLRDALRDGVFGAVSGERWRREIDKLFEDARLGLDPADALRRLADWHVLQALEPGLELPSEAVTPLRRLGKALESPPWRGPRFRPGASGLAVWLAPLAPALRRRTLRRLSIRGELVKRVAGFPAARDGWLDRLGKSRGRGEVDALLTPIDEERVFALHAWASPAIRRRILRWATEDRGRRVPVRGDDLIAVGLNGPAVGRALERIRAAYLEGAVANREEAIALARELARSGLARPKGRAAARRPAKRKAT
jgi:tRNA nucleotidyltransferase (CCA-adding enzyme)